MTDTDSYRDYHTMGYAARVLDRLAVHGGYLPIYSLGSVNLMYVGALVDRGLAVLDTDGYTLTEKGWDVFRGGTGYRVDWYGPGLVKGQRVTR